MKILNTNKYDSFTYDINSTARVVNYKDKITKENIFFTGTTYQVRVLGVLPSGKIYSIRIRKILRIIYEFAPNSDCEFFRNSEKELNSNSLRIRYAYCERIQFFRIISEFSMNSETELEYVCNSEKELS